MGLFGIFSSKPSVKSSDLVWMTTDAKLKGTLRYIEQNRPDLCVAWFDDTRDMMHRVLNEENSMNVDIKSGTSVQPYHLEAKNVLFFEHYPLYAKEANLLAQGRDARITFMVSFDDIILKLFGGNTTDIMRRLGLEEDQYIESTMVSRAIVRAQKRLEKKVKDDFYVKTSGEWMDRYISINSKGFSTKHLTP